MPAPTLERIQQDEWAMAVACALTVANEAATAQGIDLSRSLISIAEEPAPPEHLWRVHYGPRDYTNRRGGDLLVIVDEQAGVVQKVLRGQ